MCTCRRAIGGSRKTGKQRQLHTRARSHRHAADRPSKQRGMLQPRTACCTRSKDWYIQQQQIHRNLQGRTGGKKEQRYGQHARVSCPACKLETDVALLSQQQQHAAAGQEPSCCPELHRCSIGCMQHSTTAAQQASMRCVAQPLRQPCMRTPLRAQRKEPLTGCRLPATGWPAARQPGACTQQWHHTRLRAAACAAQRVSTRGARPAAGGAGCPGRCLWLC